jgi:hypothetical protein
VPRVRGGVVQSHALTGRLTIGRVVVVVLSACLATGCFDGSGASSPGSHAMRDGAGVVARPVGPPLRRYQASHAGRLQGGIGGYSGRAAVFAGQRSLALGRGGRVLAIHGIGSVTTTCGSRPRARFTLTAWAQGEGPPTVTHASTATHGVRELAAPEFLHLPTRETTHQTLDEWQVSGGGEAFQFCATITSLLTQTTTRCDVLADATAVTTGAFDRYAH